MTPVQSFFGDAEYAFRLTPALITELEGKCGTGIGALSSRVFNRQFAQTDLTETIRLALIGGGAAPKRAGELIAAYAADRPLAETHPLASKILERLWAGNPDETTNG
jgi:hypothetical protein